MVVATIGNNVLGWRAGSSKGKDGKSAWKGQVVGRHSAGKSSPAKGFGEIALAFPVHTRKLLADPVSFLTDHKEMKEDVHESKLEIAAEQSFNRAVNQQNSAVRAHYEELGFDNTDEAMQYALMVSKEESAHAEAEDRDMQRALNAVLAVEQGRLVGDVPGPSGTTGAEAWSLSQEQIEAEELRDALEQIRLAEEAEAEAEALRRSLLDM
jgi:hypothetical protein